jgi:hypothetical protein
MRMYHPNATSETRVVYGKELIAGLGYFEQTASLAPPFSQVNARLESAEQVRQLAERAQIEARVQVRFADYSIDTQLRSMWRASELADGGRRGAISRALFPEGLNPLVIPTGESQHTTVEQFAILAHACTVADADKVLGEWLPRLEEANAKLKIALQERERRATARAVASAAEESAREDHALAVDKLMGEVRAIFPKDRKRWDLIFPDASRRRRRAEPTPQPSDIG